MQQHSINRGVDVEAACCRLRIDLCPLGEDDRLRNATSQAHRSHNAALQAAGGGLRRVERTHKSNISEQRHRTAHTNLSLAEALVDPNNAAVPAESAARTAVGGLDHINPAIERAS
jgi:hypothetical protein